MAPVTAHYGYNNVEQYNPDFVDNPSALIGGCTLECPEKIIYIDELDETDNCHVRMEEVKDFVAGGKQIIEADVPTSNLYGYCTDLRSMTGGRGVYEYEFARYEQAPSDVQEKEIAARAAKVAEGSEE